MEELSLSEIRQIELSILDRFSDYCKQNDIKFFLAYGSLLGAVKYKGFIPWDDDVDVLVPRSDYDRLIKEFPSEGALELLCGERNKGYIFPFAKLCDTSTIITNQITIKDYKYGVHIDIFPIDDWDDNMAAAKRDARRIWALSQNLIMSISYLSKGRNFLRSCVKAVWHCSAHFKGHKKICSELMAEIARAKGSAGEKHCGCVVWPIHGEGEILPADVFADSVLLEFEGRMLPAPVGYDVYLCSMYGEYEKDLPAKQQRSHHKFKAYRIK